MRPSWVIPVLRIKVVRATSGGRSNFRPRFHLVPQGPLWEERKMKRRIRCAGRVWGLVRDRHGSAEGRMSAATRAAVEAIEQRVLFAAGAFQFSAPTYSVG